MKRRIYYKTSSLIDIPTAKRFISDYLSSHKKPNAQNIYENLETRGERKQRKHKEGNKLHNEGEQQKTLFLL